MESPKQENSSASNTSSKKVPPFWDWMQGVFPCLGRKSKKVQPSIESSNISTVSNEPSPELPSPLQIPIPESREWIFKTGWTPRPEQNSSSDWYLS